uniref:Uncharacterized protein n=1 Tax=Romanomermis culicivorax TaxID=13658 RepID=A0A915JJB9_ROMCU
MLPHDGVTLETSGPTRSLKSIRTWGKETLPFGTSVNRALSRLNSVYSSKSMKISRLVQKNGDCNVSHINVPRKERQYMRDIFTTLIDVPWRYILIIFASCFVISWTFFALVYFIICILHDDFERNRFNLWCNKWASEFSLSSPPLIKKLGFATRRSIFNRQVGELRHNESYWKCATNNNSTFGGAGDDGLDEFFTEEPCIANVYDFVSVFLFSVESQHTIGYGNRYIGTQTEKMVSVQVTLGYQKIQVTLGYQMQYTTTSCWSSITTLCIQSIAGLLIQSFMAGLVFAKLAGPKKRALTLIFSKFACISLRDGSLCFLVRVGDMRQTHLVEAHIRLQLIKKRVTTEGEVLPLQQYDMDVGYQLGQDRIFLVWPITICHVIGRNSPLYSCRRGDLTAAQFEIIVILEGIVESTGMTAQARTSYLPNEILWGHRFERLVTYQKQNGDYRIDYSRFHKTVEVHTPESSAEQLDSTKNSACDIRGHYYQENNQDEDNQDSDGCPIPITCSLSRNSFHYSTDSGLVTGGVSRSASGMRLDEKLLHPHLSQSQSLSSSNGSPNLAIPIPNTKKYGSRLGAQSNIMSHDNIHKQWKNSKARLAKPPEILVISASNSSLSCMNG